VRKKFEKAERYRVTRRLPGIERFASVPGDRFGMFIVAHPEFNIRMFLDDGVQSGSGWEHVSVSCKVQRGDGTIADVMPPWETMMMAKDWFWEDEECVVQFHPPRSVYVNRNVYVLHLWRKVGVDLETPPTVLV